MNTEMMIDKLYQDESLIANLHGSQAEQILNWAEARAEECESETEFERLLDELRLVNRYVAQGGTFYQLFAMLRQGALRKRGGASVRKPDLRSASFPVALLF